MTGNKIAAHPSIPSDRDILVCIFQRGAADGLNTVVPYTDTNYYSLRPDIAVPVPDLNNSDAALYLNDDYGLHPALGPLETIFNSVDATRNIAFVHATGMPHANRSHFAAQDLVERGVDSKLNLPSSGWLGRYLNLKPAASSSSFRAISISGNVPVSLQGAADPLAISNLGEFSFDPGIIDSGYPDVLSSLFRSVIPFAGPAQSALTALEELQAANLAQFTPQNGAMYDPGSPVASKLQQAAQLIKSELPVEVVCVDSDGWDHHESLPGNISNSHRALAEALDAFYTDLGSAMSRITVLVHTEFGRRLAQNGSQGTDHGTAGVAYLLGGGVNSDVYADWLDLPSLLEIEAQRELDPFIEDLKITTDLRAVLAEMLIKRLGVDAGDIGSIFPGYNGTPTSDIFNSY